MFRFFLSDKTCNPISDQEKLSIKRKQYVAYVVCHELAHQWFGNLVTMGWWTHLWLNEGFATFMGYLCTDFIHLEWQIWDQFMASGILNALNLDALDSSHPIEVPVGNPSETDEIFDAISYNKGCAIIRMLHNWISDKCFRIGMENYLNKIKYSNAQTEDLSDESVFFNTSHSFKSLPGSSVSAKSFELSPWLKTTSKIRTKK